MSHIRHDGKVMHYVEHAVGPGMHLVSYMCGECGLKVLAMTHPAPSAELVDFLRSEQARSG